MSKKAKDYRILFSDCGEFEQARACGATKSYASIEAAKKSAATERQWIEDDTGDAPDRAWIVEVVQEGFPSGFTWN